MPSYLEVEKADLLGILLIDLARSIQEERTSLYIMHIFCLVEHHAKPRSRCEDRDVLSDGTLFQSCNTSEAKCETTENTTFCSLTSTPRFESVCMTSLLVF